MAQSMSLNSNRTKEKTPQQLEQQFRLTRGPGEGGEVRGDAACYGAHFSHTVIDYYSRLDINAVPAKKRLTGIVCTIGPASREVSMLLKLMDAGMTICRLNFSHGTYEYHLDTLNNVREASSRRTNGEVIGIALDTKGPEIRTGVLEEGSSSDITLETGGTITLTTDDEWANKCSKEMLWVDYKNISNVLEEGSIVYIDDGLISLRVLAKEASNMRCFIVNGGNLGSKKGCNLPNTQVDLPAVSEKDKQDLAFGVQHGVDMVFASFIQNAAGVREIRNVLGEQGKHIKIVAKIESYSGIYNFMDVLSEVDAIMVARGDMGIEIPPQKVFLAQKMMINSCLKHGKPVICATQMLESMTYHPRATRAESGDVATAVLDGADCVMLSGESAKGSYPVEAVTHMASVCFEAETVLFSKNVSRELEKLTPMNVDSAQATAQAAVAMSIHHQLAVIVTTTESGRIAHLLAAYRPRCPIIMVTRNGPVARQALLRRAIVPHLVNKPPEYSPKADLTALLQAGIDRAKSAGLVSKGETISLVYEGVEEGVKHYTVQIITCSSES